MSIQDIKIRVVARTKRVIENAFGEKVNELRLGFPPNIELGDFTVECFPLAKQLRKNPAQIAQNIAGAMASDDFSDDFIEELNAVGPYVNFKINPVVLFGGVCAEIIEEGDSFGNSKVGKGQRVMVEYLSPNTNKPLHIGHSRNGAIGMAIANLYEATGHTVIKANLVNDRGVHICKSMLAWQKWANCATPESTNTKGDHFVGRFYVLYEQELKKEREIWLKEKGIDWDNLDSQAQVREKVEAQFFSESKWNIQVHQMLQKWEASDPEILKLWKIMNDWVYAGFGETYEALGLKFDAFYYESETYKLGKNIIVEGIEKKVFYRDDRGAIVFDLPADEFSLDKDGNPKKVTVLRADGTSVYMTQDIGTAMLKAEEHNLDSSIYVVGKEQDYHFKCLFKIMESLGYPWAKGLHHLSYGMVYLPEGKMKSREGKVVDADDLIAEMTNLAAEEIKKRDQDNKLSEIEIQKRAAKIGVGAIKFYLLRVNPQQDIHFDPKESIAFDGTTGPYCQYAYARCTGILRNAKEAKINIEEIDFSLLGNQEERLLIKKLLQFPEEVESAILQFNPGRVAIHLHETAQAFNRFYHQRSVLAAENEELIKARLALVQATAIVLKKGLNLLGIEALEEM